MMVALRDEDANMRALAAFVLGELKADDAVPALKLAMADSVGRVRANARDALKKIKTAQESAPSPPLPPPRSSPQSPP